MKPIIGIVPTSNYMLTDDSFKDHYRYGNNYIKKIVENGGIPYLIPLYNNEIIEDTLINLDGVLFPGGDRINEYSFKILDYCYKKKTPVLGICLGMQTIGAYSVNRDKPKRIIKRIDNGTDHWPVEINRYNEDTLVHDINILEDSLLYDILKKKKIKVNSLHRSTITEVGTNFKVSAYSSDNLIEVIECLDRFIVGIQFHPEILPEYNEIFKVFIKECKKNNDK